MYDFYIRFFYVEDINKPATELYSFHGFTHDAEDHFVDIVNKRLNAGSRIYHITHCWNYWFVNPEGRTYCIYMTRK